MELLDISVSFRRKQGERRNSTSKKNKKHKAISIEDIYVANPFLKIINHRKHEGLIYRNAVGDFEKKGKPRYHSDWFE